MISDNTEQQPGSPIKKGFIAFLLSMLAPGLGQIYNGQLLRGILVAVSFVLFIIFGGLLGVFHAFRTLVGFATVSWTFQLALAVYAARVAVRQAKSNSGRGAITRHPYIFGVSFLGYIALVGFAMSGSILGVRAFTVPTEAMSLTLVQGDRFMVDVKYYKTHRPNRGDVIVFRVPITGAIYAKRVIAAEGDAIEGGPNRTIVNGHTLSEPYLFRSATEPSTEVGPEFGPETIPPDELFVMGDNRGASNDSRYFGPVGVSSVIGKALYIYYSSSDKKRIGRAIQ